MAQLLVSASTGAMGSLLGKLGTMLSDEYKLLKGARGDIKFLKDELEAMHAFLLMMADVENPDPQAKLRADTVREMSYEIEDNIDKFMILVEHDSSSKSDGFGKLFNKSMQHIADIKTRHKIANDLKDIKCQVKEVSERYARYRIDESTRTRKEKVDPRLRAIYKNASDLVGVDGPRDELVKWLNNHEGESTHKPKVVSIVGYGGLGKTTLAKQVYDKLGPNYECRAFVSISRSPDMKKIFSSILSQVQNQDYTHAVLGDLQFIIDQIRAFLKDKRYFILIDDVWDTQTWEDLDCAFIRNDLGSVILTTTRINDVAKLCCPSHGDLVYKIRPLDIVDSKTLFFKRIFGCEEKCPPNLKEASEDILKKCGGLPLAINAISSLLASHKESREEWERVRRSIGFSQGKASDIDAMTYILSLSYFDLPLYLRSCLLYLTMFPEDHLIEPRRLVRRWISEGFIHAENAQDPVEVGEKYLYELINRSLIQPVDIGFDEKATWCQVHDTILDFLTYKSTEDNFCTLLTGPSKPVNRVRRLTLMGNEDVQSIEQLDLSHARSLGAFGSSREYLPSLARLNALRVLDINGCRGLGNLHVKDIGRLLQLRHLDISLTGITELPKEIGDLEYLEMLDTSACPRLVELPESVSRLKRLASLLVSGKTRLPDKIGNMTKLQRLGYINVFMQSLDFLEDLGELANLRNLSILWDTNNESDKASYKKQKLVSSLCKLERCKLRDLYVSFNLTEKDVTFIDHSFFPALKSIREISVGSGKLCWITKWMVSLVNLQTLNVFGGELEQQDVEMVGNIPNLLKLLLNRDITGPIVIGGGFQRLQELEFNPCATTLLCEAGAMPNLKCLNHHIHPLGFKSAHGDAGFNIGMQHLSSLAQVHVRVYCAGVRVADLEAAEGAFKSMADAHPNRPTFGITRFSAHRILQGDQRS